jgi:hypothetical protein
MTKIYRFIFNDDDPEGPDRQTISLAALAYTLLIIVACVFVLKQLHAKTAIEDCLMAQRNNCDVLVPHIR